MFGLSGLLSSVTDGFISQIVFNQLRMQMEGVII